MNIAKFCSEESGAVTVDWTVLAAAIVGLGIATVAAVRTGVVDLGGDINTSLSAASIASLGELGSMGVQSVVEALSMDFPISVTAEEYASYFTSLETKTEAELARLYNITYSRALANSVWDPTFAATYLDQAAAVRQTMIDKGYAIPETEVAFEDTYAQIVG